MTLSHKLLALPLLATATYAVAGDDGCAPVCEAPCIDPCCGEFYVSGSFLYWNAGLNNLYYVLESKSDVSDPTPPKEVINKPEMREPGHGWSPGVQASIGWCECACGWDFVLRGTYYKTESKDSVTRPRPDFSAPDLNFLTPLINPSFSGNFIASSDEPGTASAKWDLTFGMIDALGGGRFTPWNCLSLSPNFGLRAVWINQGFDVKYSPIAFFLQDQTVLIAERSISKFENRYCGIGFKGGIDFDAAFCSSLHVVGGFGASVLYGKMKAKDFVDGHTVDPGAPTTLNHVTSTLPLKFEKFASNLETELGLAYNFHCGCFGFDLSARYLFSIWFDQSEFYNFTFTSASVTLPPLFLNFQNKQKIYSNLIMQGVNVQLTVSF